MIHSETLKLLTDDELSILYYICGHPLILGSCVFPDIKFIKMFKLDHTIKLIEIFKNQALDNKKEIFYNLSKKLIDNK
jgi:hypothetical protein